MGMLRVLTTRGDEYYPWDGAAVATGEKRPQRAVDQAERRFAAHTSRGWTAVRVGADRAPERIAQFDPAAEQIVLIPRVVGG
jgi:hypothetical protein